MRLFLLLFVVIILTTTVFSVTFQEDIFVNPFIFGQLKDDSGNYFDNYNQSDFSEKYFKTYTNEGVDEISGLNVLIKNNNKLIILYPDLSSYSSLGQFNLNSFSFIFNRLNYEESNINILFKLEP